MHHVPTPEKRSWQSYYKDFKKAVKHQWPYATFGLLCGGLFIWLSIRDAAPGGPATLTGKMLEHLGMGFIVSSVAVVFYEWGGHIKIAVDINRAVADHALNMALEELIHTGDKQLDGTLARDIESFVTSLTDMEKEGDWGKVGYTQYLAELLHNTVFNAESLCRLSTGLRGTIHTPRYQVKVLSPTELTDKMLAHQMSGLDNGGRYSVVSNLGSWHGNQLRELLEASEAAVRRGVTIRRLFVVAWTPPHGNPPSSSEARKVLEKHLKAAERSQGNYVIKLLDWQEKDRFKETHPDAYEFLKANHIGIFESRNKPHCIRVQVASADLADLWISGLQAGSQEFDTFDEAWKNIPTLDSDYLQRSLMRWDERYLQR
ncbi:MAG: hypothetical protein JWM27_1920 [Gemmatimonadetes bacterium]|nr:hypothetical protein [Gemmatimonadota bacterium]